NPSGTALIYSTYLGGSGGDYGYGVAVDVFGNAYVTGDTLSTDFPVVNAIQPANAGIYDAFVTKITTPYPPAIAYSTYLGGIYVDHGYAVAVDAVGSAAVTGSTNSPDFPLLSAVQGVYGGGRSDAFLTRLDPAGSAMLDSTYLGGGDKDIGRGVAVLTSTGAAYLTGETWSADFPLLNPIQASRSNFNDAFISKISGTPPPVVYLTMTPDTSAVVIGSTLGYNVTAVNATAARQCFNYWENVTLPNSSTYPPTGALFGPVHLCLNAGAMKTAHQSHGVPISAPIGAYAFNAFTGAYPSLVVSKGHFNFDVLGIGLAPSPHGRERSWRILENGFRE
ncbi:MAG: SBBP repeat-containing protein, partial [Thermodesulfobacteriota bacterium]